MSLDDLSLVKVKDAVRQCEQKNSPKFIGFLSETELGNAVKLLKNENAKFCFFGGYSEASRTFLCVMPEWMEEDFSVFPISTIEFSYRKTEKLSHRDFLGAVMSLGVTKESIGDILVAEEKTYMFVAESVADYLISQIQKVGSVGVNVNLSEEKEFSYTPKFDEKTNTVASMRLDCVVSAICNCGRKRANELIEAGFVIVNSAVVEKSTFVVKQNSKISVRKHGKFIIEECNNFTKKQRIVLKYKKYL